jgi:hypothetical protein
LKQLFIIGLLTTLSFSATWIVSESNKKLTWSEAVVFCKSHKGKLPIQRDLKNASSNKFKRYFKKDFYWSRDENHDNLDEAKYFNFYDKSSYYSPKSFKLNVRCVAR